MPSAALRRWTEWENGQTAIALDQARTEPVRVNRPALSQTSTGLDADWLQPIQEKMTELLGLQYDWDGRQSAAVRTESLVFAYSMLAQSMVPRTIFPSIVPLGNGGVQLLWSNAIADVEVEVVQPNEVFVYHLDRLSGAEDEWRTETEFSKLAALLRTSFAI
jgi:hypothetical protein